jgi:hypothetical protein
MWEKELSSVDEGIDYIGTAFYWGLGFRGMKNSPSLGRRRHLAVGSVAPRTRFSPARRHRMIH